MRVVVAETNPAPAGDLSSPAQVQHRIAGGGAVYFVVRDDDPNVNGTYVADPGSGRVERLAARPAGSATAVGDEVVLRTGDDLLRTNGTPAGTRSLYPPGAPFAGGARLVHPGPSSSRYLYVYDGTGSSTMLLDLPGALYDDMLQVGGLVEKGPRTVSLKGTLRLRTETFGYITLPERGDRIVVREAGRTVARLRLESYADTLEIPGRELGVGVHRLTVQYLGGSTLRPSPLTSVKVTVTR